MNRTRTFMALCTLLGLSAVAACATTASLPWDTGGGRIYTHAGIANSESDATPESAHDL